MRPKRAVPFLVATLVAAGSILGAASLDPASARTATRALRPAPEAGGVVVDVSRLRALGLGPSANLIQDAVGSALRGGLPGAVPPGAHYVVRITGVSLSSFAGSDANGGGGGAGGQGGTGSNSDYLEGDLLLVGAGGEILAARHQVSAIPASSGGAYYLPGIEQRRMIALSNHFAAWLQRTSF